MTSPIHTDQRPDLSGATTLFVDADDTLWENNHFFLLSLRNLCRRAREAGLTDRAAMAVINSWERRNIPRLGFSYGSYEASLLAAVRQIAARLPEDQRHRHAGLRQEALRWTKFLRRHPILFLPGVMETIPLLAGRFRVVIVTKGDQHDQMSKVLRSGLLAVVHGVEVIPRKSPAEYLDILERHGLSKDEVVMIGNSPHSDINNAKKAGIRTIFVPHPRTWEFEVEPIAMGGPPTWESAGFAGLRELLLDTEVGA